MSKPSRRPSREERPRRACVFCGATRGINREHMWPDWMKRYQMVVAGTDWSERNHRFRVRVTQSGDDQIDILGVPHAPQGNVMNKTFRVVCANGCNGGWMKRLEDAVSKFGGQMMVGRSLTLDEDQVRTLAAWASKTAMIMEFDDPSMIATSQGQRRHLYENIEPPPLSHIWVGRYQGEGWHLRFRHLATMAALSTELTPFTPAVMNTQFTTFACGELLVVVFSTTVPDLFPPPGWDQRSSAVLSRLWPVVGPLPWPPAEVAGDADVDRMQRTAESLVLRTLGRMPELPA